MTGVSLFTAAGRYRDALGRLRVSGCHGEQMNDIDLERRVRNMRRLEPSDRLRDRVASIDLITAPRVTWSDRVWFSRGWRLAAATAAFAALAVGAIPDRSDAGAITPSRQVLTDAGAVQEAGQQVGLSADLTLTLARRIEILLQRPTGRADDRTLDLDAAALDGERR